MGDFQWSIVSEVASWVITPLLTVGLGSLWFNKREEKFKKDLQLETFSQNQKFQKYYDEQFQALKDIYEKIFLISRLLDGMRILAEESNEKFDPKTINGKMNESDDKLNKELDELIVLFGSRRAFVDEELGNLIDNYIQKTIYAAILAPYKKTQIEIDQTYQYMNSEIRDLNQIKVTIQKEIQKKLSS